MKSTTTLLDEFYASQLDCLPGDLQQTGTVLCATPKVKDIRFARGYPLAFYSLTKENGAVMAIRPDLLEAVTGALSKCGTSRLDDLVLDAIENFVSPHVPVECWFRGVRFYCSRESFKDQRQGMVYSVVGKDERADQLHAEWGGEVFGQIIDGVVVSWAAVKPISDVIWDLRVETLPKYQGRGCAKSVVSAAVAHILDCGKIAGWGTDRDNLASISTARSVGFQHYALDFGCVLCE